MKKLLLLLFSVMISFNSFGEWTELLVDEEQVLYIDFETLQEKSDGYVYYWVMLTYRTWSIKSYIQTDCEFKRMNVLQNDIYDGGTLSSSDGEKGWSYVAPDTKKYRNLEVICEMVNESPKQREKSIENFKMSLEYKNKINDLYEKELENEAYKLLLEEEIKAEEDLARQLIIEDQLNTLKSAYINNINAQVYNLWNFQGAQKGWGCEVYVLQDREGNVQAVDIQKCNLDDSSKARAFKDSIERAVYKASPLPAAPDDAVFDRELLFEFRIN